MIVGVNEYQDDEIPDLEGAKNDASEIKSILTDHGDFEVAEEHFLINKPTGDAMRSGISDILWKMDKRDVTLFYFSGHGFADSYGMGYLAPYDMIKQQPIVHGISMQNLKHLAQSSPNKDSVVLILDCCYSGITAEGKGTRTVPEALDTAERCFAGEEKEVGVKGGASGMIVFSSSASDQTSRELEDCKHKLGKGDPHPHGALTFHLLEGLAGGATKDKEGWISVGGLRVFVDAQLAKDPKQTFKYYGAGVTNPEGIFLARASELEDISKKLNDVRARLDSGQLVELILASNALFGVLEHSPTYQEALDLRDRLAEDLKICQTKAAAWVQYNKLAMMQQAPVALKEVEDIIYDLCLEQIAKQGEQMTGLLLTLLQEIDEKVEKGRFVAALVTYQGESAQMVPQPISGRGA